MDIDEIIISKIFRLMAKRGFSQRELANKAKINYQNLNRLLKKGRSISKSDVLPEIAAALGVEVSYLRSVEMTLASEPKSKADLVLQIQDKLKSLTFEQLEDVIDSIEQIQNQSIDFESTSVSKINK